MEELGRRFSWASLPLVATIARVLCREQTLQVAYLRKEVAVLQCRVPGRFRFTGEERRSLADAALAMGRKAMRAVVTTVKPDTILRCHRKLVEAKCDYSERRRRGPGQPRKPVEAEELVCRMARENTWGCRRISGQLAKLGICISKSCVADIVGPPARALCGPSSYGWRLRPQPLLIALAILCSPACKHAEQIDPRLSAPPPGASAT